MGGKEVEIGTGEDAYYLGKELVQMAPRNV